MKETPTLFTDRLTLRPFRVEDASDVYEYCSSTNVTSFLFWYPHRDIETTERLLKSWIKKKRHYSWCLEYQKKAIGEIQIIKDLEEGVCEIGYTLNEHYWRKGFMKEGLKKVLSYLFEEKEYREIIAITDVRNVASMALLASLGFLKGAISPYYVAKKDENIEVCSYSLSKNDLVRKTQIPC